MQGLQTETTIRSFLCTDVQYSSGGIFAENGENRAIFGLKIRFESAV